MSLKERAIKYHQFPRPGKVEIWPSKPCETQDDLSLAYTPGVGSVCMEIHRDPDLSFEYTNRANLVAVISNGSAVLGLGNIGAAAGKPVMEGKAVLFKRFAGVNAYDINLAVSDPDEFIKCVKAMEPTFGGINLEDIKAPECFYIEEQLQKQMSIPVFHDDQHGTAIISAAGLINACEITNRKIEDAKIVINGAGAAALAVSKMYALVGVKPQNIIVCDSKGVLYKGRTEGMNPYKESMAQDTALRTLDEAVAGIDVLVGLSAKDTFTPAMLKKMNPDPIVMPMANPDPEIDYFVALEARPDAIVATGRSDYPNQVNNVLGFPFLFRGALDVRAKAINEPMKMAATMALVALTKEKVPQEVIDAYGGKPIEFGRQYILPKPVDPRVLLEVAPMVAQAAVDSGVARAKMPPKDEYRKYLEKIIAMNQAWSARGANLR